MAESIKLISSKSDILLAGPVDKILNNGRARMYLKNNFIYSLSDDGILIVRGESDISQIIDDIKVIANYISCPIEYDNSVTEDVKGYQKEEREFAEFSEKARAIRNNETDIADFKSFEESLINNMKSRKLYPLQMLSAFHMAFAQNACNFSVPGAGKTSVVYGAYAYLKNLPNDDPKHVDRLFIIGPLSSFGPWELEYEECFGNKAESMRLISSINKSVKESYLYSSSPAEITLTSYQSTVSIHQDIIAFLKRNKVMLVLDEAHKIKNTQGAITATTVLQFAQYAKARIVLTGTPAPNGYEDLYNLYNFLWPNKHIIKFSISQLKNMSLDESDARIEILLHEIEPFFIRITKSNLNLPPVEYKVVKVQMSPEQKDIYDVIEGRLMKGIQEDMSNDYVSEITKAKTIRLMQAATNPVLLKEPLRNAIGEDGYMNLEEDESDKSFVKRVINYNNEEIPAKFLKVFDLVKEILKRGEKVIIWATFIRNIEMLSDFLNYQGISTRTLYGGTPVERNTISDEDLEFTREGIVREFNQADSSFSVIIANPFAVAESISLHKACHNAIYLERSFNAAHYIQSKDRIHRYGLQAGILTRYYFLISENTIDETIAERLNYKEERLNRIMESSPIPLFRNILDDEGIDDVKAIIRDYAERAKKV